MRTLRLTAETDNAAVLADALRRLHPGPGRIVFEAGIHHFHAEQADSIWLHASNHDNNRIPVACHLSGWTGLELVGENAEWRLHGRMVALLAGNCRDLRVSGIRIRAERPYVAEGLIRDVAEDHVDLTLDAPHEYQLRGDYAVFWDDAFAGERSYLQLQGFDPGDGTLPRDAPDNFGSFFPNRAEAVDEHTVRLFTRRPDLRAGLRAALKTEKRFSPAIVLDHVEDVAVEDCALHDAGGMGLLAQFCENLTCHRLAVTPPPGSDRLISVQDDATHFVHCRGELLLEDCVFERQWDDGVNLHGTYRKLLSVLGPQEIFAASVHFQQHGVETFHPGDAVRLLPGKTLLPCWESVVDDVFIVNPQITRLRLRDPLPDPLPENPVLENSDWYPAATICRCQFLDSIPRGILIHTPKPSAIIGNTFRNLPGPVIHTPAEAHFWHEAGALRHLRIADNRFEHCGHHRNFRGDVGILALEPQIEIDPGEGYFHDTIEIANNDFGDAPAPYVTARSVRSLQLSGNRPERSGDSAVRTEACGEVIDVTVDATRSATS